MSERIALTLRQRATLLALLERHLPNVAAWVYGSRVKGTSRPTSDLDIVVFSRPDQRGHVSALRESLEESDLAVRVDVFAWDEIPASFRANIESEHVVLVEADARDAKGGVTMAPSSRTQE